MKCAAATDIHNHHSNGSAGLDVLLEKYQHKGQSVVYFIKVFRAAATDIHNHHSNGSAGLDVLLEKYQHKGQSVVYFIKVFRV